MPKITKIHNGRVIERELFLDRSLRRLDNALNKLTSAASIDAIYHGDELARARRHRKIAREVFSAGFKDALSTGRYQPLFPELHEGKQFSFYDWETLEPGLRDNVIAEENGPTILSDASKQAVVPDSTGPLRWAVEHDDGRPHWYARDKKSS